jgi:hypothetical protein
MAVINEEVELLMLSAGDYELVKQKVGTDYTECNQRLRPDTRASHNVETNRYSGLVDFWPCGFSPFLAHTRDREGA